MKPISIDEYKKVRKAKIIAGDLTNILKIVKMTKKALSTYSKYTPARNVYSNLMENQSVLETNLDKVQRFLNKVDAKNKLS